MRFSTFILFAYILIGLHGQNYAQRYSFVSYSTPEGLPQSQVNAITQDSAGYLWIGTYGGVSKFNGRNFQNYSKTEGLLNNRVTFLTYLNEKIYVGHDIGFSYQCQKDSFCYVSLPENSIAANVTGIIAHKDKLYISTNGEGMFEYDTQLKQLTRLENSPERIRGIAQKEQQLYLATREGIYSYDYLTFNYLRAFPEDSYSDIKYEKGVIYATTFMGELFALSKNQPEAELIIESETHRFRNVYITNKGNIWLNSRNGALKLEKNEVIELNETSGLPINDVNIIFKDREDNVWIGTGGKGLLKFSGELFTHFNKKSGLPSELIISTLEDKKGNYWLSSFDKGVFSISADGNLQTENIEQIKNIVWSSLSSGNRLFFGSTYGLYELNKGVWRRWYVEDGLPDNKITGLHKRTNGDILIGTANGVAYFDKTNSLQLLQSPNHPLINVRDFIEKSDTLFLAAQSGLFAHHDGKTKIIQQFEGGINSLEIDKNGKVWIGSENGLYYYANNKINRFDLQGGSGTDYTNFITTLDNYIYVGTNYGLYAIETNNMEVFHYGINAGLVDLETNLNSAFIDSKNNLWFGTVAGLMKMNIKKKHIVPTGIKPKIHLTRITVNFEDIEFKSLINEPLRLSYKENNLSFEFDGLYLSNPKGINYTYKITGIQENWSPLLQTSNFNFNKLPPGNYILSVKAVTENNNNSEIIEIPIFIKPPYYNTWWFYSLIGLMLLAGLFSFDQYRIHRIRRKNYQNNLEIKAKLAQLEQQSLNASMNRHFIFNSLNSIQYYINSSDKQSANRYLTRFAKLIRKNLDSSHSNQGMVSLSDEIERLKLYLELESMRFKDKFNYSILIDDTVEVDLLIVPAMFLQPFVENSIIHGLLPLKDKKGHLQISITDHLDHIRIEIVDDGIGIDSSLKSKRINPDNHTSQGVLITKGRIELLQQISAKSIELIGPTQINENDSSVKGTMVAFKILKQYL